MAKKQINVSGEYMDTSGPKVTSAKQSTKYVNQNLFFCRALLNDEEIPRGQRIKLITRKFWFRMVLYAHTTYDTPICFLGVGFDTIRKPYKKSITIDLNEGENIDYSMNVEEEIDRFFEILKEKSISVLVMEGFTTYVKSDTVRRILKFVEENEMNVVFTSSTKELNEYFLKIGHIKEGVFKSYFEEYSELVSPDKFSITSTKNLLDFFGIKGVKFYEYLFIHNFPSMKKQDEESYFF